MSLKGRTVLVTGASRRIGRSLAVAIARAGGDVVVHYKNEYSRVEAGITLKEVENTGRKGYLVEADLSDPAQASRLISRAWEKAPLFALVNNASIFGALAWNETGLEEWDHHLMVNLTAPFLLSQAFARALDRDHDGRIINMLDWRVSRPTADHLPYTVSKTALAALTRSLAVALAPHITVNGLALGTVLPAGQGTPPLSILENVPAQRWADLEEVGQAVIFLLDGPAYITGEIIHVDGGRHLI